MRIVVHIDRLVLDGVGQPDLPRLQAALEHELTQALAERALHGRGPDAGPGAAPPIDITRGPEAIGQAIARAAHAHIAAARAGPAAATLPTSPREPAAALGGEARP